MSDYQAIYDAVRSRISGDVASVARDVMWQMFDISHQKALLQEQVSIVGYEMSRPSAIFRPTLSIDGDKWCALYGGNLQDGCAGFGDSPDLAMAAFDKAWHERLTTPKPAEIMKSFDAAIEAIKSA